MTNSPPSGIAPASHAAWSLATAAPALPTTVTAYVTTDKLRSGATRSCGCLSREATRAVGKANRGDGRGRFKRALLATLAEPGWRTVNEIAATLAARGLASSRSTVASGLAQLGDAVARQGERGGYRYRAAACLTRAQEIEEAERAGE